MNVDLRLLRYFLAVADELHFGRAAAALFVSQPALSQQIRKLETELGTPLFDRDRRAVTLTAAGQRLLGPARRAVEASEEFVVSVKRSQRARTREVAVGFMITWPDGFLSRVLRTLRQTYPEVHADVRQYDFRDTSVGLRSGEMDVSLLHLPLDGDEVVVWPLFDVPRVVMLAADLALAGRPSVTVADLVASGLVWSSPPAEADRAWQAFWTAQDERSRLGGPIDQGNPRSLTMEAYLNRIAAGGSIGLTEATVAQTYTPEGIAFVPVSDLSPSVRAVAWQRGESRQDIRDVVTVICETANVAPPPDTMWSG